MDVNQSSKSFLNFLIPFLIASLGSKGIFYYFSFEYSLFSDTFDFKNLLIDLSVFVVLFYLGTILVKQVVKTKNKLMQ